MDAQNQEKKSFGPLIGIIVIIAVLVVGGLYFWGSMLTNPAGDAASAASSSLTVPANDDLAKIEADLNASVGTGTDFSDIETELTK